MKLSDLQHLIDAHGTDPDRWPPAQRAAAEGLLAREPTARTMLDRARTLDAAITRTLQANGADEIAARRVLAGLAAPLPRQKRGLLTRLLPSALTDRDFAPAWPRLAVLACGAALGLVVGLSSFGARVASDLIVVARVAETEVGVFDVDSITGLQP